MSIPAAGSRPFVAAGATSITTTTSTSSSKQETPAEAQSIFNNRSVALLRGTGAKRAHRPKRKAEDQVTSGKARDKQARAVRVGLVDDGKAARGGRKPEHSIDTPSQALRDALGPKGNLHLLERDCDKVFRHALRSPEPTQVQSLGLELGHLLRGPEHEYLNRHDLRRVVDRLIWAITHRTQCKEREGAEDEAIMALVRGVGHGIAGESKQELGRFLQMLVDRAFKTGEFLRLRTRGHALENQVTQRLTCIACKLALEAGLSGEVLGGILKAAIKSPAEVGSKDIRAEFDGQDYLNLAKRLRDWLCPPGDAGAAARFETLLSTLLAVPAEFDPDFLGFLLAGLFEHQELGSEAVTGVLRRILAVEQYTDGQRGAALFAIAGALCPSGEGQRFNGYGDCDILSGVALPTKQVIAFISESLSTAPQSEILRLVDGLTTLIDEADESIKKEEVRAFDAALAQLVAARVDPLAPALDPTLAPAEVVGQVRRLLRNCQYAGAQTLPGLVRRLCEELEAPAALRCALLPVVVKAGAQHITPALMVRARRFILSQVAPEGGAGGGQLPRSLVAGRYASATAAMSRVAERKSRGVASASSMASIAVARDLASLYRALIDGARLRPVGRPVLERLNAFDNFCEQERQALLATRITDIVQAVTPVLIALNDAMKTEWQLALLRHADRKAAR